MSSRSDKDQSRVANGGWLRPPLVLVVLLVLAAFLDYVYPFGFQPGIFAKASAALMAVSAILLFLWSCGSFKSVDTPVSGNRRTSTIVSTGPYRWSRNPIYIAFVLLGMAVFVATGIYWMFAAVFVATLIIGLTIVPREERFLLREFGATYHDYAQRVPRWF